MSSRPFGLLRIKQAFPGQQAARKGAASADTLQLGSLSKAYEESGLGWFWATDREGRLTYLSAHIAATLAAHAGEALGQPFAALFELDRETESTSQRTLPFLLGTHTSFAELNV